MFKSWRRTNPFAYFHARYIVYEHYILLLLTHSIGVEFGNFWAKGWEAGINSREQESCSQVQSTEITIKYEYFMPLGPWLNSRTFVRVFRLWMWRWGNTSLHTITPYLGKQIPCLSSGEAFEEEFAFIWE